MPLLFCAFFMKSPLIRDDDYRFSGKLRHYHRTNTQPVRSWDDWVDGAKSKPEKTSGSWVRGILIASAVVALMAVLVGLFIELR